jgi:threonine/homoserine/homoserine lactone efflux protein
MLAARFATLFLVIRYVGAAYLFYLAWKLWNAHVRATHAVSAPAYGRWRLFFTGLAINLGNPKVIVFFLAVLPAVISFKALTPINFAELAVVIMANGSLVLGGYVVIATGARRVLTSPARLLVVNRVSSVAIASAAAAIVCN